MASVNTQVNVDLLLDIKERKTGGFNLNAQVKELEQNLNRIYGEANKKTELIAKMTLRGASHANIAAAENQKKVLMTYAETIRQTIKFMQTSGLAVGQSFSKSTASRLGLESLSAASPADFLRLANASRNGKNPLRDLARAANLIGRESGHIRTAERAEKEGEKQELAQTAAQQRRDVEVAVMDADAHRKARKAAQERAKAIRRQREETDLLAVKNEQDALTRPRRLIDGLRARMRSTAYNDLDGQLSQTIGAGMSSSDEYLIRRHRVNAEYIGKRATQLNTQAETGIAQLRGVMSNVATPESAEKELSAMLDYLRNIAESTQKTAFDSEKAVKSLDQQAVNTRDANRAAKKAASEEKKEARESSLINRIRGVSPSLARLSGGLATGYTLFRLAQTIASSNINMARDEQQIGNAASNRGFDSQGALALGLLSQRRGGGVQDGASLYSRFASDIAKSRMGQLGEGGFLPYARFGAHPGADGNSPEELLKQVAREVERQMKSGRPKNEISQSLTDLDIPASIQTAMFEGYDKFVENINKMLQESQNRQVEAGVELNEAWETLKQEMQNIWAGARPAVAWGVGGAAWIARQQQEATEAAFYNMSPEKAVQDALHGRGNPARDNPETARARRLYERGRAAQLAAAEAEGVQNAVARDAAPPVVINDNSNTVVNIDGDATPEVADEIADKIQEAVRAGNYALANELLDTGKVGATK